MQTYGCPIGAKFQVTIPKEVRMVLGIKSKGDLVGFMVEGNHVNLTKARIQAEEVFSDEEWQKILQLSKEPSTKTFKSGRAFLKDLKKHTQKLSRRL